MKIQDPNKIVFAKKKNKKTEGIVALLDLDGVVSFWEKSAAKTLGVNLEDKEIREAIKNGKGIESYVGGDDKMWSKIDAEGIKWWREMELLPWAKELYEKLNEKADHFCFLTSPSNNPSCAAGKIEWLKKHFGENFKDFLIGRNKHLCASSRSILIDDNKGKIKKFRSFGGHVFQWPHPLSLIDGDIDINETIKELMDYVEDLSR